MGSGHIRSDRDLVLHVPRGRYHNQLICCCRCFRERLLWRSGICSYAKPCRPGIIEQVSQCSDSRRCQAGSVLLLYRVFVRTCSAGCGIPFEACRRPHRRFQFGHRSVWWFLLCRHRLVLSIDDRSMHFMSAVCLAINFLFQQCDSYKVTLKVMTTP